MDDTLDMAVIIPRLAHYGGAERYAIECLSRWQHRHNISVYSTFFNRGILLEHGLDLTKVRLVTLHGQFEDAHRQLLNGVLLPKIWEQQIDDHQVYVGHQWPTQLIDRHPLIWFPHEPLRELYDLRYVKGVEKHTTRVFRELPQYANGARPRLVDQFQEGVTLALLAMDQTGKPDRIVANSRHTAEYLTRVQSRLVTDFVYPGVNPQDSFQLKGSRNKLLMVNHIGRAKRVRLALEALRFLEDMHLDVVGGGEKRYIDEMRRVAKALGVSERVSFHGHVTNQEVQIFYAGCLAVLFTPVREPFGIVALEAMAAGKPLIAVLDGGYTEVVDESCAFLVPPEPAAIADKIRCLREDPELAQRMGEAGLKRVQSYTWDHTAEQLLAIVEETCAQWWDRLPQGSGPEARRKPLVGIHYCCGYGEGLGSTNWADQPLHGVTDMPALGYYASFHEMSIKEHLQSFEQLGVDFAVLQLHVDAQGINDVELAAAEHLFTLADELDSPVKFAVQICPRACRAEDLQRLLGVVRNTLVDRARYLRLDRRPVVFFRWDGSLDRQKPWLFAIEKETAGFLRIASATRPPVPAEEDVLTHQLFESWTLATPLHMDDHWQQAWSESASQPHAPTVFTLAPGYDDTHLPEKRWPTLGSHLVARAGGQTYQRMIDFTLSQSSAPDLLLISSFNDFHCNDHVEPSVQCGRLYLDKTANFIDDVRRLWNQEPVRRREAS